MRTVFYLMREAWANLRTNRTTTMVAIGLLSSVSPGWAAPVEAPLAQTPPRGNVPFT